MPKPTEASFTYQNVLAFALRNYILYANEGDVLAAWRALRNLYSICPYDVREEVKEDIDSLEFELGKLSAGARNFDPVGKVEVTVRQVRLIMSRADSIVSRIVDSLCERGYFKPPKREIEEGVSHTWLEKYAKRRIHT